MSYCIFLLLLNWLTNSSHPETGMSNAHQVTYYYSTVEFVETPLSYIKGSIPISQETALTRNHYRFTYDQNNKLLKIEFYNGHTPRHPNHTANLFTLAHRMEFTYESDREIITFFDIHGQASKVLGDCVRFVYQLNALGFRESLYFENETGERIENSWNIYNYQWSYESDGSVIENRFNMEGVPMSIRPGFEFFQLRLFFNPAGHIALMQNIDAQGNLVENTSGAAQDQISTNAVGNFLKWEVLDKAGNLEKGNGPNVAVGLQSFNEWGYEIRLEQQDENKRAIFNNYGICISETKYDDWGNIKERRFFDELGKPSIHQKAGYHQLKLYWDNSGNYRKKLAYFDTAGNPTVHQLRGYHQAKYQYNDKNKLTKISYLSMEGQLVNRKDNGTAYIKYTYDSTGELLNTVRFSKDHQIIKQ